MDDPPQWDAAGGSRQVPPLKNGPKGLQSAPVTVGENSVDENPKLPGAQDHSDVGPTTTSSFDPTTRERVGSVEQRMPEVAAAAVTGARASHFRYKNIATYLHPARSWPPVTTQQQPFIRKVNRALQVLFTKAATMTPSLLPPLQQNPGLCLWSPAEWRHPREN